jgi:thiamine kinase-like enzyme
VNFTDTEVEKLALDDQGRKLAEQEEAWYKKVISLGYKRLPEIYSYSPLKMQRILGKNIYEYNTLTPTQKKEIIKKIIGGLKELHSITPAIPSSQEDCVDNYINKTFDRLSKVKHLIPFGNDEFLMINGRKCKNVFHNEEVLKKALMNICPKEFHLIHGDPTFSNIVLETERIEPFFIDPRGYFGKTKFFGDINYDWAKLYYSVVGNYDQFNLKNFSLEITESEVNLKILSSNWEDMEEVFFEETKADKKQTKLIHAIIWLSLTTYAWEDYDSICGAFYNGLLHLEDAYHE